MARKREIKPAFFKNEDLGELSPFARLLYIGMWTQADREGRLEDRPKRIKSEALPYDNVDGEELVSALAERRLILRYEVDGQKLIWIPTFREHQHVHPGEQPSKYPPHPMDCCADDQGEPFGIPTDDQGDPLQGSSSFTSLSSSPSLSDVVLPVAREDPIDAIVAEFATYGTTNQYTVSYIEDAIEEFSLDWVRRAVKVGGKGNASGDKPPWEYVEKILKRWKAKGEPDDNEPPPERNDWDRRPSGRTGRIDASERAAARIGA